MTRLKLHWQILIALVLAVIAGQLAGTEAAIGGITFYTVFDFLGTLFIQALRMLIVPLIMSSIIVGVAGIGSSGSLGRLGGKTLLIYMFTTTAAVLVGLILVNLIKPGVAGGEPVGAQMSLQGDVSGIEQSVGNMADGMIGVVMDLVLRMVPPNIVEAAVNQQMLGMIFFSLLFGFFMTRIAEERANILFQFWDAVFQTMMRITEFVMAFAPIGVFGLVATTVAETGLAAAKPLVVFALTVLLALAIHAIVTLPLLLRTVTGLNPWRMFTAMAPALMTAFSTASSQATVPVTIDCVEKNAGVSNRVSSFIVPLGATVNMDGTAMYECVAALFLAQAYGLDLSFAQQFVVVVVALITSVGVAGIPSASLVAIAVILAAIGLPVEAIGLLFVFDRILDMVRTAVNIFGDSFCAVIVASLDGEKDLLSAPDKAAAEHS